MVLDALNEVDSDSRAEMLEEIVVVGGSAHLDGLGDRLEEDLKARQSQLQSWIGLLVICYLCCSGVGAALLSPPLRGWVSEVLPCCFCSCSSWSYVWLWCTSRRNTCMFFFFHL